MPELFASLLALSILAAICLALVLGVVAFARTRRLRALTRRIEELERRLEAGAPTARSAEADEAAAAWRRRAPRASDDAGAGAGPETAGARPPAPTPERELPSAGPSAVEPTREERPAAVPASPRRAVPIDWERWLGVRGAALVGGLLLALSGLLLVQYSIQQGWITPALRVALAAVVGVLALAVSELLHRRGYRHVSNALAGAGAVMVYGALWAGRTLYGLFGFGWAFPGMVAVTVASGWMALRRPSLVVAVFALVGGFVTPLLVSLGAERPLGLFGYLLVFDLGLVVAARRPRWGLLGLLGSLGTFLVFGVFALRRLQPQDGPLAIAFLGLSALVLALPVLIAPAGETRSRPSAIGAAVALLGAFPLALYVAARGELQQQLVPLALLAATLEALAGVVALRRSAPLLAAGASLGAVALVLAWVLSAPVEGARAWHLVVAALVLAAVPHAIAEWRGRRGRIRGQLAGPLAALGLVGCSAVAALDGGAPGPAATLAVAVLLTALLLRQAHLERSRWLILLAACVPGATWLAYQLGRLDAVAPGPLRAVWLLGPVLVAALFALHAWLVRRGPLAGPAGRALAWSALALLLALGPQRAELLVAEQAAGGAGPLAVLLATLALLGLGVGGSLAAGSSGTLALVAAVAALVQSLVTWAPIPTVGEAPGAWLLTLLASALVVATAPALVGGPGTSAGRRRAVGALAPWLWLPALLVLFADHVDQRLRAGPALTLAVCAGLAWIAGIRSAALNAPGQERARTTALAAGAVSTIALLSLALTLQLERGIWFVAPALAAAGAALTWRRARHPLLPWVAALLLAWSTARLGLELALLAGGENEWPRTGLPVLHWGTYGWALPAIAALVAARALRDGARSRLAALAPAACAVCGLLLLFVWVNLEVQNLFGDGPRLELELAREPVRDAATSIAWGLYALVLLVAGLRTKGAGLRWASLAFFLAALVKAFLVDLSNLEGLYRVASIAALALALLAVSLLYQRFVFRREERDEANAARA